MYGLRSSAWWGLGAAAPPPAISQALQNASASSGVPISLLNALAFSESSYNPAAVSSAGAQGLLQLMPATAKSLGVSNPFDAQQNATAGASYLESLYQKYGNWNDALIAYNEGPTAFDTNGPYSSSQMYASTILQNAGLTDSVPTMGPPPLDSSSLDSSGDSGSGFDLSSIDLSSSAAGLSPLAIAGIAALVVGTLVAVA